MHWEATEPAVRGKAGGHGSCHQSLPGGGDEREGHLLFHENEAGRGDNRVSGSCLGMGVLRGMDAVCLIGVTSGYLVDPKAASEFCAFYALSWAMKVSIQALEEEPRRLEKIIGKLQEMERAQGPYLGGRG